MSDKIKKIIELAEKYSVIRPKDVEKHNIPRQYVYRLYNEGKLEKIGRGLYKLPDKELSEDVMLFKIAKKVPNAVICLISALRFHDMTTQNPFQVWIAIHNKDRAPGIDLPLKITRMTGGALEKGREEHLIDDIKVNVYNPAKTVADCFKFRNKVGLDVAIEALREYKKQNKGTVDMLWKYSKIDRVQNVIRPYIEAVYE
ncbi:MAG: type IV toxin-antitoxin system AbiEi family antitoxin domain-containing protein [Elusimicrobiota bacterium]